ncbi:jg15009 [Pararge aegeria aegeria]|uniref:Jg15009 protein n=1 Tax=Pararge aegeria aegeria TaxID=348720 RepID=A0A8S4QHY9_9NEOP|nr:jg15009 [Pararge aegeria aegeria]
MELRWFNSNLCERHDVTLPVVKIVGKKGEHKKCRGRACATSGGTLHLIMRIRHGSMAASSALPCPGRRSHNTDRTTDIHALFKTLLFLYK